MFLGQVLGTVVASARYPGLEGVKLLIVQPLDHKRKPKGSAIVAVDTFQAGHGEIVFLEDGREASFTLQTTFVPIDAAVVGVVDMVDTVDSAGYHKGRNEIPSPHRGEG